MRSGRQASGRRPIRTSEPIGTNPQARNARSDWALPGDTWAQHRLARAERGEAGADQPPAVAGPPPPRVEQLDGHLAAPGEAAAEHDEPGVVAVHLDVAPVLACPLHTRVVVEVVRAAAAPGRSRRGPTSTASSEPISPPGPAMRRSTSGCDAPP